MLRCEGSVAMVADAEERAKGEVARGRQGYEAEANGRGGLSLMASSRSDRMWHFP